MISTILPIASGCLSIIMLAGSCEKPAEVNLPAFPPKLVVHGFVQTGTNFKIAVGRTISSLERIEADSVVMIRDATIVLFENDLPRDTLVYLTSDKRYVSTKVMAQPGNTYKIVIHEQGFEDAEAITVVPPFVATTSVSYARKARRDANNGLLDDVEFQFTDPAGQKNYYLAEVNRGSFYNVFCVYSYNRSIDQFQGNVDPFETVSCLQNTDIAFNDRLFEGQTTSITLSAQSISLEPYTSGNTIYRPYFKKYSVTQEFYTYVRDGGVLDLIQSNPFAQPFNAKGNVKNGFGLFTVYSATTDTLR